MNKTRKINLYKATDFSLEEVLSMKGDKKIYAVFSTYGEREADLIYDKINIIRTETGSLVDKIFLSHRRLVDHEDATEKWARLADQSMEIVICNNVHVTDMGREVGKGADMRRVLYHINKNFKGDIDPHNLIIVYLDADVTREHFGTHFVYGLTGAVLDGCDFAKGSFHRRMGRINKFVARPLFAAIDHPSLNALCRFAYPLAGEAAGTLSFFNSVNFWQRYGVETGMLIDACMKNIKMADVNLGLYDHKHQDEADVQKMAFGIVRAYLTQLRDHGVIEFKNGASIADSMRGSTIDGDAERKIIEIEHDEMKYCPLVDIL